MLIAPKDVVRAAYHGIARDGPIRFQPHTSGEIIIEDDCWICSNAVITSNVTLAKGTVVTKSMYLTVLLLVFLPRRFGSEFSYMCCGVNARKRL